MKTLITKRESATREGIIAEALALAAEEGWKKVTVRAIASRLGYQPPVLYQFFKNKDDLIRSILLEGFEKLTETMTSAKESAGDAEQKLLEMTRARFRFAVDHAALHSLMFTTNNPTWFKETVFSGMCQNRENVASIIREISGRSDDCLDLVTNFISIIKGYTFFATELPPHLSATQFFGDQEPEEALAEAMKKFIKSIRTHD